ncbi:hypothetical protein KIL84_007827 [Mauremys mutica]|uniref:Uncharacterized protein n=1 Tax=Mauremys mutica TaxID=74926 RepID=A0A9D3WY58_9SAUR|nr:hypothetical protein KIL84_007827 [Mauremys mutica]
MFNPISAGACGAPSCINVPLMYVQGPPRPAPLSSEQGGKPNWKRSPGPTALPAVECWAPTSTDPSSPMGWDRSIRVQLHELEGCLLLTEMHPWPLPTVLGFDITAVRELGLMSVCNQAVLDQVSQPPRTCRSPGPCLHFRGSREPHPGIPAASQSSWLGLSGSCRETPSHDFKAPRDGESTPSLCDSGHDLQIRPLGELVALSRSTWCHPQPELLRQPCLLTGLIPWASPAQVPMLSHAACRLCWGGGYRHTLVNNARVEERAVAPILALPILQPVALSSPWWRWRAEVWSRGTSAQCWWLLEPLWILVGRAGQWAPGSMSSPAAGSKGELRC